MAIAVDNMVAGILERTIDKEAALRTYQALSEAEKASLVQGLKSRLEDDEPAPVPEPALVLSPLLKSLHEGELSDPHKNFLAQLAAEFGKRVPKSKHNALVHQVHFVDQRKVAGLKRALKSMQFQLTYDRADGAYLYDVDGNTYVDITGDNGVNFFGHRPAFIKDALIERLERGYPLVAYSEDLFESARLFCEITGHDRMVFTQTGTEAVMWALRIARAATGKKKVVIFDGSYHGLSDTVLAMRARNGASVSAGLGLLQEFADQLIILDYGDMDQLATIERDAAEIACVLVEPVQSRFPARRPHAFVQELRKITLERDIVLIFDEMITGFRAGARGAEAYYKVKPDMATYGKIAGGGMPTGIIAGIARLMDYVDGGVWSFDDASMPSLKRAVIAGTHTQNSLKVAATLAACRQMQQLCQRGADCNYATCSCPIGELNRRTARMCDELNAHFADRRVPLSIDYFASLFRFNISDDPYGLCRELLIVLLKLHDVETSTSGNNFLNLSHGDAEVDLIIDGFRKSIETMIEHGFFHPPEPASEEAPATSAPRAAPVPASPAPADSASTPSAAQLNLLRELVLAELRGVNQRGH